MMTQQDHAASQDQQPAPTRYTMPGKLPLSSAFMAVTKPANDHWLALNGTAAGAEAKGEAGGC